MSATENKACVLPTANKACVLPSNKVSENTKTKDFTSYKNQYNDTFGDANSTYPVESNRYRLVWAAVCPWAHRVVIARSVLGLDNVISLGTANSIRTENGWEFSLEEGGKDSVLGIQYLPEMYALTDPDYVGKATIPALVDAKQKKIVNNDPFTLSRILQTSWTPFHAPDAPNLFPEDIKQEMESLSSDILHNINNGAFTAYYATSQSEYEDAFHAFFNQLDVLEERLSKQRYLFGSQITDTDIQLYVSLARLDIFYFSEFKLNRNRLVDFPNLWAYARDLYQQKGFGDTTDFNAIRTGYTSGYSHDPHKLISVGYDTSIWNDPHNRA